MTYATRDDMIRMFGEQHLTELTDFTTPRAGEINDLVLIGRLTDASAWIDGFLSGRYPLPITNATALATLNVHCCNVARYFLMTTQADEQAKDLYKAAESFLTKVAAGTVSLIPPADTPAPAGVGSVSFEPGTKWFGRDSGGFGGVY